MRLCPRLTLLCPASPPQVPSPPLASSPLRFLSALAFSSPPLAARQKAEAALEEEKRLRGQVSSRYGELLRACFENNQGQYLSDHAVTIQRAYICDGSNPSSLANPTGGSLSLTIVTIVTAG